MFIVENKFSYRLTKMLMFLLMKAMMMTSVDLTFQTLDVKLRVVLELSYSMHLSIVKDNDTWSS